MQFLWRPRAGGRIKRWRDREGEGEGGELEGGRNEGVRRRLDRRGVKKGCTDEILHENLVENEVNICIYLTDKCNVEKKKLKY